MTVFVVQGNLICQLEYLKNHRLVMFHYIDYHFNRSHDFKEADSDLCHSD